MRGRTARGPRIVGAGLAALTAGLLTGGVIGVVLGALPSAAASTSAELPIPLPTGSPSASPAPTPSPQPSPSGSPRPKPTPKPTPRSRPTSSPTKKPSPAPTKATVTYRVKTTKPVYFITVDDGYTRDPRVIDLVRRAHIPLTAFLIRDAARQDPGWFRRLQAAGATLEDHTLSHPYLTTKTPAEQHAQICNDAVFMDQTFGRRPTLFRPPYGKYDDTTLREAASCRITQIVMWDAVESDGAFSAIGGRLQPGMIVILHFRPSLYDDLQRVLRIGRAAGLHPASLEHFLTPPPKAKHVKQHGPRTTRAR